MNNKLTVVIGGLAFVAIVAITLSITLTADRNRKSITAPLKGNGDPITFDDFIRSEFRAKFFNGTWFSDNQLQWRDLENNLVLWNVETNETEILVGAETVGLVSSSAHFVDFAPADKSLLLFYDNEVSVWRHSFVAEYLILDSKTNAVISISPKGKPDKTKLQYAQWIPQTSSLIYVYGNNVYIRKNALDGSETDVQLTKDGIVDTIYNGIPDWVYEEEILSTNKAMYFNNQGTRMAMVQFNDTEVLDFYYTKFGEPSDPLKVQYPEQIMLKYPKVGTPNPTIKMFVVNLESNEMSLQPVIPPTDLPNDDYIYTAVTWISENQLSVIWTNRVQNESSVSVCKVNDDLWQCSTVTNPKQSQGWLDVFQPPQYSKDGSSFLQILPLKIGDLHYPHIKIHTNQDESYFVTNGEFVVTSILLWNENDSKVYFIGTGEKEPGSRHLYSAKTDRDSIDIDCITCKLETQRGQKCKFNSVKISPSGQYYVHSCLGPNIPEIVLRSVENDHKVKYIFELNEELEIQLQNKAVSDRIDLTLTVGTDPQYQAPVVMRLPRGYDPSKKYPLLLYVYGGPGSQNVDQRWSIGWGDYLTSNYGIVYATIDGRGTGYKSNEYMFEVFHKLGTVEMEDQIAGAKQLLSQYSFLDASKTGIWGWSYGGYATAMTLIKDTENVFKCGISTAPPTNWLFYDSMYTERFMGLPTPEDNLVGYQNGSLLDKVEELRGKKFQLNHGVADDNVHFQQSMLLIRALELENIDFEQNSYPDENHGLGGVRRAVYTNFDQFWSNCFDYDIVNQKE